MRRKPTILNLLPALKYADASEGSQPDLELGLYEGKESQFTLHAVNEAGSSPTLDIKLQEGDRSAGQAYADPSSNVADAKLREGATTNVELAAKFTQSGAADIKKVSLMLKTNGTIAAGKKLTVEIHADSSSVPSGTALVTSATVDIDTEVTSSYTKVTFTFATALALSDATDYWIVLTGDYTASATNNVTWKSESSLTSGGNSASEDGTTWTADADDSRVFDTETIVFTDVSSGAFTQVTDAAAAFQTLTLSVDGMKQHVRPHITITGTSTPAFFAAVTAVVDGLE